MNEDLDYRLYVLAELAYEQENEGKTDEELFPIDWYSISNYQVKTEIIAQAIKNKILISETELYKSRVEGVRNE